jgi:hypothetical protein
VHPRLEMPRAWLWSLLLAVASAAVLLSALGVHFFPVKSDELSVAWMGKQAAAGRTPYLDYFCFYPPLLVQGLARVFKAFGASLAVFRLLTLLWLLGVTLLLERLFLRARMPRAWAAGTAFLFPALLLPFWPVPSHHWFALGFGLASLWAALVAAERRSRILWLAAGLLASCCGLCLQTEGALFCALTLLAFILLAPRPTDRRAALLAVAGLTLPLLIFILALALQGALPRALYCLVTWPANYYKQPGGFNDLSFGASVLSELQNRWPGSWSWAQIVGFSTFLCALGLGLLPVVSMASSPSWTAPQTGPPLKRWAFSSAGLLCTWAVFLRGRAEWVHFTLFIPVMLVLALLEMDWTAERVRPGVTKGIVLAALAAAGLRWSGIWLERPPLLGDILRVDALVKAGSVPSVLGMLPARGASPPPVVFLPHGADLYFYWAPDPPPVDWVEPPSFKYNAPGDFEALASFLERRRIRFVLIQGDFAAMFLDQPSPIQRVLSERYRPVQRTPLGLILERAPDAPTAP